MDFNHVKASGQGALDSNNPRFLEMFDVILSYCFGCGKPFVRDIAGCQDIVGPAVDIFTSNSSVAQPWRNCAGFPPGMIKLNTDLLVLTVRKLNNPLQWFDLRVLPQARVFRRNPPFRRYRRTLNYRKPWPSLNDASKVGKMPCCMMAIFRGVLAKRRQLFERQLCEVRQEQEYKGLTMIRF